MVAGLVGDDRQQPRTQRLAEAKPAQCVVSLYEGLLGRLLGIGGAAADDVCDAEGDLLVFTDERRVRVAIAVARALDQLVLCQWPAHHHSVVQRGAQMGSRARKRAWPPYYRR